MSCVVLWLGSKHKQFGSERRFLWLVMKAVYNTVFYECLCSLWALLLFHVLQEAILITSEAAASHSVIPRTFSGNSLVAEIHLQILLVSLFPGRHWWVVERKRQWRESSGRGEPAAIINFMAVLSGQKYTQMIWKGLRGTERRGGHPVESTSVQIELVCPLAVSERLQLYSTQETCCEAGCWSPAH